MATQREIPDAMGRGWRIHWGMLAALPLMLAASAAAAQEVAQPAVQTQPGTFTIGKIFTFLFLTLGPMKLLAPFERATRGRDGATKRKLALRSSLIAVVAVLVAPLMGEIALRKWNVSLGALLLTAGLLLFLIALKPIVEQFASPQIQEARPASAEPGPLISPMALAFPTIVTPYGIAILIVLLSLSTTDRVQALGVAIVVLLLDLIGMLFADRILRTPFVAPALGIVGTVLGVLQVALGVQAMATALRLLGLRA